MTRQEKNRKYRQIGTLESLDAEISDLHHANAAREEELKIMFGSMPDVYTPRALAREGIHRAAHSVNFYGFALSVVTFAKKMLKKR